MEKMGDRVAADQQTTVPEQGKLAVPVLLVKVTMAAPATAVLVTARAVVEADPVPLVKQLYLTFLVLVAQDYIFLNSRMRVHLQDIMVAVAPAQKVDAQSRMEVLAVAVHTKQVLGMNVLGQLIQVEAERVVEDRVQRKTRVRVVLAL
jgi:hypothetical protein